MEFHFQEFSFISAPFNMALKNVEVTHECCPQQFHREPAKHKFDIATINIIDQNEKKLNIVQFVINQ